VSTLLDTSHKLSALGGNSGAGIAGGGMGGIGSPGRIRVCAQNGVVGQVNATPAPFPSQNQPVLVFPQ
jgi:hypothetical protein